MVRPLVAAAVWAVGAAIAAPVHLALGAGVAAAGFLWAVHGPSSMRRAGLAALPAVLAGAAPPAPPVAAASVGPAIVAGMVVDICHAPSIGRSYVRLGGPGRGVELAFPGEPPCLPGDRLTALARRAPPAAPGIAPLWQAAVVQRLDPGHWSLPRALAALRRTCERVLCALVQGEQGAVLASLVLGRSTRPDRHIAAAHQATGLSHLLAVSGAHAAMLAFLLGLADRGARLGASRVRAGAVLLVLFVYGGVAGAEPPVVRSVIAFALAAVAVRRGRPFGVAAGLAAPALVTCIAQPDALLGPSFLLSYAAVVGLGLASGRRRPRGALGWLGAALWTSWWAALTTAPLTLWFFGQLAPWTVLLTPVLAPLVALLLLLGLATATLGAVSLAAGGLIAPLADAVAQLYIAAVVAADGLPGTPVLATVVPPGWAVLLAVAAATGLCALRPTRAAAAVAIGLIVVLWFLPFHGRPMPRFLLFAVGHGQAALAETTDGRRVVVDCGSLQHPMLAARSIAKALLRRHVDLLVVTHADADHHNGVAELLAHATIRAAVLPASLAGSAVAGRLAAAGAAVQFAAAGDRMVAAPQVEIHAPRLPAGARENDHSLWVRIGLGGSAVLLCGDAQELGVAAALAAGAAAPAEVLVLPHHGRPNAHAHRLLARVRPQACLASAACIDGETALGALARRLGAELWVTGQHGTIEFQPEPPVCRGSTGARPLPATVATAPSWQ